MCTHYTLLRNARSKQRSVHVRNSEVRTFETAKCARSKQRSAHLRLATQVRAQILPHAEGARLVVSPKPREARADQERFRRPSGGVPPRGRRLGKSTPATSPERGVVPGRQGQAAARCCASLDPHPLRQCPKPLRGPLARFSSEGRVKGVGVARSPVGRGHGPLTRPERPKPAGRVSGALFPRHPCPRREAPAGRRRRL